MYSCGVLVMIQAGHAVLGRCEELLTTKDIEICKPRHFAYCVNVEATNIIRGLAPGQVIETYTDALQSSAEERDFTEAEAGSFTVTTRGSMGNQWYNEDQLTVG